MARSPVLFLVCLLAFGCATVALAEAEPFPEPKDAEAQFELGKRLAFGLEGTKKDQRAAVKWFRLAAEQGHPRAQMQLGMAYQKGRGVRRDIEESNEWMRKAAEQGYAKAQFELGVAYRDGRGIPRDRVLGLMWLFLSQEKGGIAARLVGPGLARQLKPRDRKEAWELVYQWREAHGLPRIAPPTPKAKLIQRTPKKPARKKPADSEAAPTPQDRATPAELPPKESDAPPPK